MEQEGNTPGKLRLFKYFSPERVDVLRDNRIRLTPPSELNDPFEVVPYISLSDADYEGMYADLGRRAYAMEPILNPAAGPMPWHEWKRRYLKPMRDELLAGFRTHLEEFLEIFPRQLQVHMSEMCGLLCLSENHESLLMWAHYTRGHTGFVLEFDPEKEPFNRERDRVIYKAERPIWKKQNADINRSIFFTKSPEWSYEKEHRVLRSFAELEERPLLNGKKGYFAILPEASIKAVYCGCRMQNGAIAEVLNILKRSSYDHVKVYIGLPAKDKFRMNFLEGDQIQLANPSITKTLTKIFGADYSGIRRSGS